MFGRTRTLALLQKVLWNKLKGQNTPLPWQADQNHSKRRDELVSRLLYTTYNIGLQTSCWQGLKCMWLYISPSYTIIGSWALMYVIDLINTKFKSAHLGFYWKICFEKLCLCTLKAMWYYFHVIILTCCMIVAQGLYLLHNISDLWTLICKTLEYFLKQRVKDH